jgi:hypothetical protein
MRAQTLTTTLKALFNIQRTVCIEGPPGGGKTTITQQVARELGVPYVELHMPTMLVEDFGVLYPSSSSDELTYKLPHWFPVKGKAPERGILCFDDRNQASSDLQKVLANICQARTLHGHELPDGWMVISTGNRQSDRAGANRVLGHLRNRETVIPLETHLDDWTQWAIDNGVKPELISFIRFRPGLLHEYKPDREHNPTPRSWVEGVSDVLGTVPAEAEYECFSGAVGEGAAAEFTGFIRIWRKLPNPDSILLNPTTAAVPEDPATLYALAGSLASRASESNFDRMMQYTDRMPAEFSVLTVTFATRRDPALADTPAFTQWAVKHQSVLF